MQNIQDTYNTIETIIKSFKTARQNKDYFTLGTYGIALLEYMPKLVEYSVTKEAEYRKFEAKMIDERDDTGKRYTSSYCETKAKASEAYEEWNKAKQFIELLYELVQMSKKLMGNIDREFNAN